jgi:hypothetical protein
MTARSFARVTAAVVLLAPGTLRAQEGLTGKFTIAFQLGTQSEVSGQLMPATTGALIGKAVSVDAKSYRDIYRPGLRLQGVIGYGVAPKVELAVRGTYYKKSGLGVEAGSFDGRKLYIYFDDTAQPRPYKEVGGEIGLRYYIAPQTRLKSYIAPVVGVRHVEDVLISFSIPEAGSAVLNVPFTKATTVPVFGLDLGVAFDLTKNLYIGVDAGLRYQKASPQFNSIDTLAGIDDGTRRWTAPVVAALGVRF